MSLISKYVKITPNGKNYKYYENLGYEIPRYTDKYNHIKIDFSKKMTIKVKDLQNGCAAMVKVKCDLCGKEYETHYSAYYKCKHDEKSYCLKCAKKLFNINNNNKNNNKTYRHNYEYQKFVKSVLRRDNCVCQCCGETENIVVHHLNGYDWYVEGRLLEENAITLCKYCHTLFHSKYGLGNNTKEQFEEWLNNVDFEYIEKYKKEKRDMNERHKQIYCLTTDKIFNSFREAASFYNICQQDNIRVCCNGKSKSAGKLNDGTKLRWMYYQDYLDNICVS